MRNVSLATRIEFDFKGNVVRKGLTFGDVDNDGEMEFIIGNSEGEVVVFKGREKLQTISKLGFVTCLAVGDILNRGKQCLVIVTGDGWFYIYSNITYFSSDSNENGDLDKPEEVMEEVAGKTETVSPTVLMKGLDIAPPLLRRIHCQRIPPNAKDILLDDIDGDGAKEIVIALTDRVVRSYRWQFTSHSSQSETQIANESLDLDSVSGSLVCLNKWECAKQIGSISLHHDVDGTPALLVAQPGGTFMRIRCSPDDNLLQSESSSAPSESSTDSSVDYQLLGLSRMRNPDISTEIVGDLKTKLSRIQSTSEASGYSKGKHKGSSKKGKKKKKKPKDKQVQAKGIPYAVATLDGTIMLVQDEIILWALAVDHQIFALTKLDVTQNGRHDIIACTWDGFTYILDENKNTARFQLTESVQAFETGYYSITSEKPPVTCFAYYTFKNRLYLYYDVGLNDLTVKKFEPDMSRLTKLIPGDESKEEKTQRLENLSPKSKRELVSYLLYEVTTSSSDEDDDDEDVD